MKLLDKKPNVHNIFFYHLSNPIVNSVIAG